jgi:CRP-like cAMP-binding protein
MSAGTHAALSKFLDRLLLRSKLRPEECAAILNLKCQTFSAPARRDIVSQGTTVDYACLVVDGLIARFDQMRDGNRHTTAFYIAGDLCDLHSVVAPKSGWALAALSKATILRIPRFERLPLPTPRSRSLSGGIPRPTPPSWQSGLQTWAEQERPAR